MTWSYLMIRPDGELVRVSIDVATEPPTDIVVEPADLRPPFERIPINTPHLAAWAANEPHQPGNLVGMLVVAALGDTIIDLRGTVYFTSRHAGQVAALTDDDADIVTSMRDAAVAALTDIDCRP